MGRRPVSLEAHVAEALRRHRVRGRLLLAVSGGADSTALLRAAAAVAEAAGIEPMVAHFDHGLRTNSADDAVWVADAARGLGIPCVVERSDVAAASVEAARGIEETARRLRYDFLIRSARSVEAGFIATAHTADDQAETVLFHVLRGTGLRGLAGIPPRRRLGPGLQLVRPMLDISRAEVEGYLSSIGQEYRRDASNADPSFTRNLLRHRLLPELRAAVNPRLDESLLRLSRHARESSNAVRRLARKELRPASLELTPSLIRLRTVRLRRLPRALLRETLVLAWSRAGWPRQRMGFDHWDAVADIVVAGGRRTLPDGVDARRVRGELVMARPTG